MARMRSLWMFPLTFVAGVHGFALFAPYLLVVFGLTLALKRLRVQPRGVPVVVSVELQASPV